MIERLAAWYLKRRGRCVLPRAFVGLAVGYGQAVLIAGDCDNSIWRVTVPGECLPIALNHAIVMSAGREGGWAATADKADPV